MNQAPALKRAVVEEEEVVVEAKDNVFDLVSTAPGEGGVDGPKWFWMVIVGVVAVVALATGRYDEIGKAVAQCFERHGLSPTVRQLEAAQEGLTSTQKYISQK